MKKANLVMAVICPMLAFSTVSTWAQDRASDTISSATATASLPLSSKDMRRADRLLAKKVRQALVKVKNLDSTNIVVSAKDGSVLLGGTVPAGDQIQLATATAEGVSSVREVKNALRIRAPGQ